MKKIRKAVIPVAGLGTRFLPVSKSIPKEMLPIVDTPIIQLIVEEAVAAGIEDIIFVSARHKEAIENHFDYHRELEEVLTRKNQSALKQQALKPAEMCNVISVRQKNPLGLGHAVLTAKSVVGNEPFAVLLGDDLIDSEQPVIGQLIGVFNETQTSVVGVMEVAPDDVSKYGIVGGEEIRKKVLKVSKVVEKPAPAQAPSRWAIPGRYVLQPEIFDHLEKIQPGAIGEIQLTDGLQRLADNGGLLALQFRGQRYDAGDRLGFLEANLAYALKRPELRGAVQAMIKRQLT